MNTKPMDGMKRIAAYSRQNAPKGYRTQRLTPKQIRRCNKKFRKINGDRPF